MKKHAFLLRAFGLVIVMSLHAHSLMSQRPFGDRILLIINFNHPYYRNIPFFQEVYGPQFPHMIFYGEKNAEGVEVRRTSAGAFAYITLADAMKKNPDYDGYLWINDDCGITMARLMNFDKNKIWAPSSGFGRIYGVGLIDLRKNEAGTVWEWWKSPYGITPAGKVYQELLPKQREQLHANKMPWQVPYGMAEAFYIPQAYKDEAIALAELCYKHGLWIEIAFPWLIDCLEVAQNRQEITILWGEDFSSDYKEVEFFHPIKLSNEANRNFMRRIFNEAH